MRIFNIQYSICIWCVALCALFFASCEQPEPPVADEPLTISLSTDTVYLTQNQLEENAVTVKWTGGTNHGTGSALQYTLLVTISDTTAEWQISKSEGRMLTLTHDQLNDSIHAILKGREHLLADRFVQMTLRLKARVVMTDEIQTSQTLPLAVSTFTKNILYLVGSSAVNGWNKDKPTYILSDTLDADIYRWSGSLKKGEFKLLTTMKDWNPCYVRNAGDASKMALRMSDEDGQPADLLWKIKFTGNYEIECNTRELTITITPLSPAPDYGPEMYIIGDATPYGWNMDRSPIMAVDITDEDTIFSWTGELKFGNFKFMPQIDDWDPCYVRDPNDPRHLLYRTGKEPYNPDDLKWFIPHDGIYTITIVQRDWSLRIEEKGADIGNPVYYNIWLMGSATPSGWGWDGMQEMHPTDNDWNIFTWEGELNEGELKFPTEKVKDYSGNMLYAPVADCTPSENATYIAHGGGPDDYKWKISETGTYRITINANNQTISFKKL